MNLTLQVSKGTQAVLELEDSKPDVLFETVGGSDVPLWPQFRTAVWSALNTVEYDIARAPDKTVSRFKAWLHIGKSFLPSRWDAAWSAENARVVFLVGGSTVSVRAGRAHNNLVGDYARSIETDAAIIEWAEVPGRLGRPAFPRSWSLEPTDVRAQVLGRFAGADHSKQIKAIVSETMRLLDLPLAETAIESITTGAIARERIRPRVERSFSRVLDKAMPEVVVMEDASYGFHASLIAMMKTRGILVAEPQHGWIGPTHAAYNFGAAMFEEPLRTTLPDHLLTFGNHWAAGLCFPGKITAIGKPHLEDAVAKNTTPVPQRSEVLVVSSTTNPDATSNFVLALRHNLSRDLMVTFRPHPSERSSATQRYSRLHNAEGITIDQRPDVYEALGTAKAVVGVASTVLFEARAFGCHVFVRQSPMTDLYVGDRFGPAFSDEDVEMLACKINNLEVSDGAILLDADLWSKGAVPNFSKWLDTVTVRKSAGG